MSKNGYLEVFQRVPPISRYRESTVSQYIESSCISGHTVIGNSGLGDSSECTGGGAICSCYHRHHNRYYKTVSINVL